MTTPYSNEQVDFVVDFIRRGEKPAERFGIGMEAEHFVLRADTCKSVHYGGPDGVEGLLYELSNCGFTVAGDPAHLLELHRGEWKITLEPGAQFEFSSGLCRSTAELDSEYRDFLGQVLPILERRGQLLVSLGYRPNEGIDAIPFIPKVRYACMNDYFARKGGQYARNMMKGTASVHIALDFESEADYTQKYLVGNALAPVAALLFENTPMFEQQLQRGIGARMNVWLNCDDRRCGTFGPLDGGYAGYAEQLLLTEPIMYYPGGGQRGELAPTEARICDLLEPGDEAALDHYLSTVFPDVRTKQYIECRTADALPYPLCMSIPAFWRTVMYNPGVLDALQGRFARVGAADIDAAKRSILSDGVDARYLGEPLGGLSVDILRFLRSMADAQDAAYLEPLYDLARAHRNYKDVLTDAYEAGGMAALVRGSVPAHDSDEAPRLQIEGARGV